MYTLHHPKMDTRDCSEEVSKLMCLVRKMKANYLSLESDLNKLKGSSFLCDDSNTLMKGDIIVSKMDMLNLSKEIRMLKSMLGRMISKDILPFLKTTSIIHEDLQESRNQLELVKNECEHWKCQWKNITETVQREKEEKMALSCELQEVNRQLSQQSDFCATMGASCCTLLWRVTRCEDSIPTILVGTKVDEFLGLVVNTLDSYLNTYSGEPLPPDSSDEVHFVLALCGIVTNIAATPYGRDFLMKHPQSEQLINIFVKVLGQEPCKKFARIKNLILMALYNLTINQKGLKYITTQSNLLPLLVWQLQAENELENKIHSLHLLQSLLYEQLSLQMVHQIKELMQGSWLEELCSHHNQQLRDAAKELQTDICMITSEQ